MGLLLTAPEPPQMPAPPQSIARPPLAPLCTIRPASRVDWKAAYVAVLPESPRPEKRPRDGMETRAFRERSPGAFFEDVEIDRVW